MKAFYVGDNRTNINWGRGASIALRELLLREFEISGAVTGDYFTIATAEVGYVGTALPRKYYKFFRLLLSRKRSGPAAWYLKLEGLLGAHDFISEDPAKSVDEILAHKNRYPALARIYDAAQESDLFVVDGDGDIVFSTPPRRQTLFLLAMIELGIRLKKPVFLVNSMISDCPVTGRNQKTLEAARRLFGQCRAVALRDPESMEYAQKEMPELKARLIPDSLFAWYPRYAEASSHPPVDGDFLLPHPETAEHWGRLDFSHPYICIGGGALSASQPDKSVQCYGKLVDAILQLGYRVYLTENDFPDSFLHRVAQEKGIGIVPVDAPILSCGSVLAHARLFISGRYHPSIFASLGGTPCIFLGSHAHKMGSLSRVLNYEDNREFDAFPNESEIEEIVKMARKYLDQGETLRQRVREAARLRYEEAVGLPAFIKLELNG